MHAKKQYHDNIINPVAYEVTPSKSIPRISESNKSNVNNRDGRRSVLEQHVDAMPSNKLRETYHGAKKHVECQGMYKSKSSFFSLLVHDSGYSLNKAAHAMQMAMLANGVDLSRSPCIRQINMALNKNCVGISPQKPRSVTLPSSIEKGILLMVNYLRENNFPSFLRRL